MDDGAKNLYLEKAFTPYMLHHIERLLEHDIEALARTKKPEGPLVGSDGLDAIMREAMQRTGAFLHCETLPCEYHMFDKQAPPVNVPTRVRVMVLCGKSTIGLPVALLATGNPVAVVVAGALSAGMFYVSHQIGTLSKEIAEIDKKIADSKIKMEKLQYPSFNHDDKSITFIPETREQIFGTAIHEYTHFLQHASTASHWLYHSGPLSEGHARGVTRNIMNAMWNGEPTWMHDIYNRDVGELKSVYRWASAYHGWPMSEALLSAVSTRDEEEDYHLGLDRRPTNHAIGNAYFKMYEQDAGTGIYADIMRD